MSKPYFDSSNNCWCVKVKNEKGKWRNKAILRNAQPPDDPRIIPDEVLALASAYQKTTPQSVQPLNLPETIPQILPFGVQHLKSIPLAARIDRFVSAQCRTLKPKSADKLVWIADRFKAHAKNSQLQHLQQITASEVRDFVETEIAVRGCQEQTLKAQLSLLGKLFSQAIGYGEYSGPNPIRIICRELRGTSLEESPKYFDADERTAFLAEIHHRTKREHRRLPTWVEDAVLVMLNTGIRVSALIAMEFSWIDTSGNGKINVPKKDSKSGKPYSTLLNGTTRKAIERRRAELGPNAERVFPELYNSANLYYRLSYVVRRLVKTGQFKEDKGHYNHILRHTFITEALNAKIPLVHVSKMAGHTTVACTQRYDHTTFDDAINASTDVGFKLG